MSESTVGGAGVVRIGNLLLTLTPLSLAEETALERLLRRSAAEAAGDNYTRCAAILAAMNPTDRAEAVREIARRTMNAGDPRGLGPVDQTAYVEFRFGPQGLPLELLHRARKATPGLDLAGLRACITEANADDVAAQLLDVLEGTSEKKASTPTASPT